MLCPICNNPCSPKLTTKNNIIGVSCEIITISNYYHIFIYASEDNFMLAIYYTTLEEEQFIIVGCYNDSNSVNFIFSIKNKTFLIPQFNPCSSLEVIDKYLNMKAFI